MKLTKNWLRTNATPTVYQRGASYQDAVRKLKKEGDVYTAKVDGTEVYKVEIVDSARGIQTDCTCPYDYEGVCKHIVAVGLNIIEGNYKEAKSNAVATNAEPIETTSFYKNEFQKARLDQQEAFLQMIFTQDEDLCQRFLTFIQPKEGPLSITPDLDENISDSTDLDELSNEIAALVMDIDIEEYLSEDDDDDDDEGYNHYNRHQYDDYDEGGEMYDMDALSTEITRLVQPYGNRALRLLQNGELMDAARVMLSIYESAFLVEEPDFEDESDYSFELEIDKFLTSIAAEFTAQAESKSFEISDFQAILDLILARLQHFKRFHGKAEAAPYEILTEDFFHFIIQKAKAEQSFLDFMTANKLHTSMNFKLTKQLCNALDRNGFFAQKLAVYALESAEFSKELLQLYVDRNERDAFVGFAQKACEKYGWTVNEFVAERILPTDNLGFFKKIVSETAATNSRVDLFQKWRAHVTPIEQENYIQAQKKQRELFHIALLEEAKRYSDILIFAEESIENLNSTTFETAAKLVFDKYPDEIFPLYCERIIFYMGNEASSRNHYQTAVSKVYLLKEIEGKKDDLTFFVAELRKKFNRLPAFLDELKKGGF
jgi:hypothetical protein